MPEERKRASVIVYDEYPGSAVVLGGELASGAWDATPWEVELLEDKPWGTRATPANTLRGQTALREQRPLTALRPEVYDPASNAWSAFGPSRWQASYHLIGLAADGKLYQSSGNPWGTDVTWRLDPSAPTPTWSVYLNATTDPLDDTITGVLYRPDRMMKCGGTNNAALLTALTTSKSLELGVGSPQWQLSPDGGMAFGRVDHNLNLLPNGQVLVTGGIGDLTNWQDEFANNDDARQRPELWDPTHQDWLGY